MSQQNNNQFYIMPRDEITNNYIIEEIINNTSEDNSQLQNIYQEIPLIIEGHSIIINDAAQVEDLYDQIVTHECEDLYDQHVTHYDTNNFVFLEPCQNCNWLCCNGECFDELPHTQSLTRILTNAHIPDNEPEDEKQEQQKGNQDVNQKMCINCNKNPITNDPNPYCFEVWCSVCNIMLYSEKN